MTTTQEIRLEHTDDVFVVTDKHHYIVLKMTIDYEWEDCNEVGSIALLNLISGKIEVFTIWCGSKEGNSFYVCLPTDEDDEEEVEVTPIDFFDTDILPFKKLSKMSKFKATHNFLEELKESYIFSVSFLEAYRTLRDANHVHLYDKDGLLLSNDGIY